MGIWREDTFSIIYMSCQYVVCVCLSKSMYLHTPTHRMPLTMLQVRSLQTRRWLRLPCSARERHSWAWWAVTSDHFVSSEDYAFSVHVPPAWLNAFGWALPCQTFRHGAFVMDTSIFLRCVGSGYTSTFSHFYSVSQTAQLGFASWPNLKSSPLIGESGLFT